MHPSASRAVHRPTHLQSIDSTKRRSVYLTLQLAVMLERIQPSVGERVSQVNYSCTPFNEYGDGPKEMITITVKGN